MALIKKWTWALVSLLLLTSCTAALPPDPRVSIIDNYLKSEIEVSNISYIINSSGLMEVQVSGVNKTGKYKKLEYKIEWLDQDGFAILSVLSRWTEFPVFQNAEFRFQGVAPKTSVANFKIMIREGAK